MAVPKDKVLPVLKAQLKGKGYPTTFIEKTAERYAAKIETEADIDDYVTDRVEDLIEGDKEADRRATAASKKTTTETVKKITGTETETEDEPTDDIGKLTKLITGLADQVKTLQAEKTASSLADKFKSDERLKGINPVLLKGRIPTTQISDEDLDALIEETATELKPFASVKTTTPTRRTDKPFVAGGGVIVTEEQGEEKVPEGISKFTEAINKSNSQVKTT